MSGVTSYGFTVEELRTAQVRCSYPSKVCMNPRATKLCGSLHKLCEFHRKKANTNQKRLQQRRRVVRAQMAAQMQQHEPSSPSQQNYDGDCDRQSKSSSSPSAVDASSRQFSFDAVFRSKPRRENVLHDDGLTDQDAQLLQSILFGEAMFSGLVFGSGDGDSDSSKSMTAQMQSVGAMETLEFEVSL